MNLFLQEVRQNRSSTISWAISLTLVSIAFIAMFPFFQKDAGGMQDVLAALPPVVRSAIGLQVNSLFTIIGFYSYVLTFIVLTGAVQAMNLGLNIVAKEGTLKTVDFLLTKPISRNAVLSAKFLAAFLSIALTNGIFLMSSLVYAKISLSDAFSGKTFLLLSSVLFLVQLVFLAIGFLISVSVKKIKSPSAIALPIVFAFFIIGMLDSILGVENIRYITPFKFFDQAYIVRNSGFELRFLVLELILIIVAVSASYFIYNKRDIDAVT